jgi:hypothetical protein
MARAPDRQRKNRRQLKHQSAVFDALLHRIHQLHPPLPAKLMFRPTDGDYTDARALLKVLLDCPKKLESLPSSEDWEAKKCVSYGFYLRFFWYLPGSVALLCTTPRDLEFTSCSSWRSFPSSFIYSVPDEPLNFSATISDCVVALLPRKLVAARKNRNVCRTWPTFRSLAGRKMLGR